MLKAYKVDNGLSEPYDCAGFYGPTCSGGTVAASAPMPKWRHKSRWTSWHAQLGLGLSLQWRHVGKVKAETTRRQRHARKRESYFDPGLKVKAQNYFDLAAHLHLCAIT